MKESPILFSAPMVRAILDGRKTQTRRVAKLNSSGRAACPYGKPGDRLWVRETTIISPKNWNDDPDFNRIDNECCKRIVQYLATDPNTEGADDYGLKKTPSIFMPRWASRILLEITGVRVERLQDISECDAKAEGSYVCDYFGRRLLDQSSNQGCYEWGYRSIWESLNGPGSWDLNPFVWVVEFKVLEVKK